MDYQKFKSIKKSMNKKEYIKLYKIENIAKKLTKKRRNLSIGVEYVKLAICKQVKSTNLILDSMIKANLSKGRDAKSWV